MSSDIDTWDLWGLNILYKLNILYFLHFIREVLLWFHFLMEVKCNAMKHIEI